MLKEIKYLVYIITIFFSIFFVVRFYISENNIKRTNRIILQYQDELDKKLDNLPIFENDTDNIIEYTNEIEKFKNKKESKWWILVK